MAKRILVLGASGFIGTYLFEQLTSCGYSVTGTYHSHPRQGFEQLNILDPDGLDRTLSRIRPELVVFVAGTKDVGRCEREPGYAIDLNVQAVRNYIAACDSIGIRPCTLYFSTDYVFDGIRGHYRNVDAVGAKTVYGATNMLAERLLQTAGLPALILRVSAVMGRRGGFFRWLEDNFHADVPVELFDNTYFSPTSIGRLCDYVRKVSERDFQSGVTISHLSDGYRMTRYQFGRLVAQSMGKAETLVTATAAAFNGAGFQPDLSLLPDGMTAFRKPETWNELEHIF